MHGTLYDTMDGRVSIQKLARIRYLKNFSTGLQRLLLLHLLRISPLILIGIDSTLL